MSQRQKFFFACRWLVKFEKTCRSDRIFPRKCFACWLINLRVTFGNSFFHSKSCLKDIGIALDADGSGSTIIVSSLGANIVQIFETENDWMSHKVKKNHLKSFLFTFFIIQIDF